MKSWHLFIQVHASQPKLILNEHQCWLDVWMCLKHCIGLKLNHTRLLWLKFQKRTWQSYPEDGPPVVVDYYPSSSNKNPESTSVMIWMRKMVHQKVPCPFIVHGLTGEEFSTKTMKTIKAIALQHLTSEGKILAIGHAETPESIYGNLQLFPSMLPWLFLMV